MKSQLSKSEKYLYGLAGMGQAMVYTLSSTFLMPFFTDILAINTGVVGTIFLITRFWDAINDPIMGALVDKTKTRFGKMRPYIILSVLPIFLFTILSFLQIKGMSGNGRIVYAVVIYVLWGMFYTLSDIPYAGLSCSMTSSTKERTKLLSVTKFLIAIGTGIPVLAAPFLISALGYFWTSVIFSLVGMSLFTLAFFGTKERAYSAEQKTTFRGLFKAVKANKPLLLLICSGLFNCLRFLPQSAGIYFATYNLGNSKYFSLLGGVIILSSLVGISITQPLLKVFTKRDLYIYSSIFGSIMGLIMYLIGYESLVVCCLLLFFASLPIGMFALLFPSLVADTVDYAEWKTGQRTEGVSFAFNTFIGKLTAGIAAFITGVALSSAGFIENAVQTEIVHDTIYLLVSMLPAIGSLLCIFPMLFYKFTEKQQEAAMQEIAKRKTLSKEKTTDGKAKEKIDF